jgi:hypothetical protein
MMGLFGRPSLQLAYRNAMVHELALLHALSRADKSILIRDRQLNKLDLYMEMERIKNLNVYLPSCMAPVPFPYIDSKSFSNYGERIMSPVHPELAPFFNRSDP